MKKWYSIDELNSDDEYCYIDLEGIGTVVIKQDLEGLVVDVYPLNVADEPVASTWVRYEDFMGKDKEN